MAFQERYGEIRRRIVQIILAVLIAPLCVVSIAPASAAIMGDSITLDSATDLVELNETATAVVTAGFVATSASDTVSVTVVPVSSPAGHSKTAQVSVIRSVYAVTAQPTENNSIDISVVAGALKQVTTLGISVPNLDYAGTYVFRIVPTLKNGSGTLSSTSQTWTITVREPNIKMHLTNSASTTGNNVQFVLTNQKDFPNNAWAVKNFTLDSSDNLQSYIEDGTYQVQVSPNTDEATTRVLSTAYTFVISGGVVTSFPTSAAPVSGVYQLALGTTGLNVTSTIGGTKKTFNVIRISAAHGVTRVFHSQLMPVHTRSEWKERIQNSTGSLAIAWLRRAPCRHAMSLSLQITSLSK